MRYDIVFDRYCEKKQYGRLRVRCGNYVFTKSEGFGIANELEKLDGVIRAEADHRSGSIMTEYVSGRKEILSFLDALDKNALPCCEVPLSAKADEEFEAKLTDKVIRKVLTRFLPVPVRQLLTCVKAISYIAKGLDRFLSFDMTVEVLDATAIGVSIMQKNYSTASSVMFLLSLSDLLEDYTRQKTKLALSEQLALNVDSVWVMSEEEQVLVPFSEISVGDTVIVRSGSIIPFDGCVNDGEAMVNQQTMTGESEPVHKKKGDSVFAGTAVEAGNICIEVRSLSENSRLSQIIELIDESEDLKAGIQSRAEHLADSIVPYSFLGFGLVWLMSGNIQKALSVLMVDFSCAIKLSTPISVISAMREAAEHGATVKGGKYLESYAKADTIVFDKTGTLTNACPKVVDVIPFNGYDRNHVLKTAACLEEHFPHSVAAAVVKKAAEENLLHNEEHAEVEYLVAHGIVTTLNGERAVIGSAHFIFDDENVPVTEDDNNIIEEKSEGSSSIFLALGGRLAGMLVIDDPVREDAADVINALRGSGIDHICMLTGDAEGSAKRVANALKLDMYVSQVLPENKSEHINKLKEEGRTVIMVGDGINDTPALAAADVSIAMSAGSDIARQVADISLCTDDLSELAVLREISEKLMERINGNYRFIVGFNASLIALGIAGILPAATSALLHNASTMLISAKSMTKLIQTPRRSI